MWFKCMKRMLPLTVGIIAMAATASPAYATTNLETESAISQQKGEVSGQVTGENGEPLVGVTVFVKGTQVRAVTDTQGRYTIKANRGQTLTFSYIGYQRAEMRVQDGNLNVQLKSMDNSLNEAVVIGYGTVRKADLAGSVAVMDNKQFKDQPVTRIEDALQGRVSGVQVISSGMPGGDMKIRVRGTSSINLSNDPLYVVDGIVRESGLEGLNPEDIQSIQVLKDASSTAIYGSRGANGVVLVTTKTGRAGQTQVVFDATVSMSNAYHIPEVMGTKEYAQALVDYGKATAEAMAPYISGTKAGIDWMDEILRTGVSQNYKLAISKGNDDTQFYVSGNYLRHNGVITDTQFERYAIKANVHSKLYKWLEMTADVNLSQSKPKGMSPGQNQSNPLWVGLNYSPTMEMMDNSTGKYNKDVYNNIQNNPIGLLRANQSDAMRNVVGGHIDLRFYLTDGLTFTTTNGVDYSDRKAYGFNSTKVMTQSSMSNSDRYRLLLQSSNNLTYNHTWNGGHTLTATGVWEATSSETRTMSISGDNLANEGVGYWDVSNAKTRNASNAYEKWTLLSGVARVMYNYKDRYMVTGTFRADGSSRFTNEKWGYFPSIAAAWTVTQEEFMKDVKAISNLKIRASYGVIGNQNISPYSTLGIMGSLSYNFGTNTDYTGYWMNGYATPDLTWEKVKQFDLGVEIGFFQNRLGITFDYYNKRSTDALLSVQAPGYQGGASYWTNAGEISNKGVDISVTARIFQTKDFSWTTSLNGSYQKNKVVKLTADDPILYGGTPSPGTVDACTIVKEGEPIGAFYGYKWAGLQQQADGTYIDTYYAKDGSVTASPSGDDKFILGCATPDFTLGWNNALTYKNWDFNVFFNSSFGAQRLNLVRFAMNSMIGASSFVTDKHFFENVGNTMPTPGAANNYYGNSSKWIEDADYLRCENISVAYTLPKSVAKIASFRFSLSAQNLFTITGYKGIDPAGFSFHSNGGNLNDGIDMGTYPNPRTFSIGVRATF